MDLVNILARILDSERHFNGSADLMTTVDQGYPGYGLGFWMSEVRIVDLKVSAEISLSPFYVRDVTQWRK